MKLFEKLKLKWNRKAKEIVEKGLLPQTDEELLLLLHRIDAGYQPTEAQTQALKEWTKLELHTTFSTLPESVGQLAKLQTLDLSKTRITALPASVGQLAKLQTLNLGKTRITALPESLGQLASLQTLNLYSTQITALPESVGQLAKLQELNLSYTQITALPEFVGQLVKLQTLDLHSTPITALPESIGQLAKLQKLTLWNTPITALPESVGQLAELQTLDLERTAITALPESIGLLAKLQTLNIERTAITALPESIGQLVNLQTLNLSGTPITALPESVGQLANLQTLYLIETQITALPDWLGRLPALRRLDLWGLTLPAIPEALALRGLPFVDVTSYSDYPGVNLRGVTLTEQDKSIFLWNPELIPSLYEKAALRPVRECRVIFLGDGESGKSYTIKRFRNEGRKETKNEPYITSETPGVEILDYRVERGEESFDVHFWDFGGQQLLHSMHRCFLSEGSCYVVTVKTRETKANERARYWLRNVTAFAPKSPILLFVNCWENDDGQRAIDEPALRREYPNIQAVVRCSAKRAEEAEFRELMGAILKTAAATEGVTRLIPDQWIKIRNAIARESEARNYLDKAQYHALCAESGVEDELAPALLEYFNNLGVCFSYHRDAEKKELADYKLLKPVWLTNALYAIIEEGMVYAKEGRISKDEIEQMLCNRAPDQVRGKRYRRTLPELIYQPFECPFILNVAIAHDLCYPVDGNTLFFPALCGSDTPPEALSEPEGFPQHVSYLLRYAYLPENVLHQLMIRCLRNRLSVACCWQQGMVLYIWKLHRIFVRMLDTERLRIDVYSGAGQRAYELFWLLLTEIDAINRRLNISAKEYILDETKPGETNEFPLGAVLAAATENSALFDQNGNKHNAGALLGQFYEESFVQTMRVENGAIVIPIAARSFHPCAKGNAALRKALYEAYNEICPYCGKAIPSLRDVQVDHILPTEYRERPELQSYLDYLSSCGFNIEKPDYIENYFPTHGYCNRDKSNRVNEFTLPYWHDIAAQHAPRVLRLMEKLQGKEHLADD